MSELPSFPQILQSRNTNVNFAPVTIAPRRCPLLPPRVLPALADVFV
jgi:hypothetical protein